MTNQKAIAATSATTVRTLLVALAALVITIAPLAITWSGNGWARPTAWLAPLMDGRVTVRVTERSDVYGTPPFASPRGPAVALDSYATAVFRVDESEYLTLRSRVVFGVQGRIELESVALVRAATPRDAAVEAAGETRPDAIVARLRASQLPASLRTPLAVDRRVSLAVFVDREHIFLVNDSTTVLLSRSDLEYRATLSTLWTLSSDRPVVRSVTHIDRDHLMFNFARSAAPTNEVDSVIMRRDGSVWPNGAFSWLVRARTAGRLPYVAASIAALCGALLVLLAAWVRSVRVSLIRTRVIAQFDQLVPLESDGSAILDGESVLVQVRANAIRAPSLAKDEPVAVLLDRTEAGRESNASYRSSARRTVHAVAILPGDAMLVPFALDAIKARIWSRATWIASGLLVLTRVILFDLP